jgi:uncharacterized membrane protein SpoIIM required for sporulation
MAEPLSAFVTRRRPDWSLLERLLDGLRNGRLHLEELSSLERLYRRAAADLSRAQVDYPGTDVCRFLNQLCGRAYAAVYRAPPLSASAVRRFYARTFPAAVQSTLRYTQLAAALLALGAVLGALTVALEPATAERLVGPGLLDFLERRSLWTDAALDVHTPAELASAIFLHNLQVSFSAFAAGLTLGIGTVLIVAYNGLFLGATLTASVQHGVGAGLLDFMSAHGPVELSVIAITAGGGLIIGHAMVDPGERPRAEHVRERARLAVQLVLGCAPFLVAIGVVEGFVSPGPLFPWPLKAAVGLSSGVGFWRYLLRALPGDDAPSRHGRHAGWQ